MSVTITIAGNIPFCIRAGLEKVVKEECGCAPNSGCPVCNGTGVFEYRSYPFEMNLANGNFSTLWNALALDFDYCGEIDARTVASAIQSLDPELLLRAERVSTDGPVIVSCGIHAEQATRYLKALSIIADEAERREENIVWY